MSTQPIVESVHFGNCAGVQMNWQRYEAKTDYGICWVSIPNVVGHCLITLIITPIFELHHF